LINKNNAVVASTIINPDAILDPQSFDQIVFFTGAGMSAESGVPIYRGKGGIWDQYDWQKYACQEAFEKDPVRVLDFHEIRRSAIRKCKPHPGYDVISKIENSYHNVSVITQNIDGLHFRAGSKHVIELHGSLWRLRCDVCQNIFEDFEKSYIKRICKCGHYLRPDIVWFGDNLSLDIVQIAEETTRSCDLFVSIGTSGFVWPAAGFQITAKSNAAFCVEVNPNSTDLSRHYDRIFRGPAAEILPLMFEL
jgi:NAD-dependent deacetylase